MYWSRTALAMAGASRASNRISRANLGAMDASDA